MMVLATLTILLCFTPTFANFGGSMFQTRQLLSGLMPTTEYILSSNTSYTGRAWSDSCYKTDDIAEVLAVQQDNSFLEVVNFMEFVQTSSVPGAARDDAIRYYNVSTAAMEAGNQMVAQENMARAMAAIDSYNEGRRTKRSTDEGEGWSASDLFDEFRSTMGEEALKNLLHLNKKVAMAFVIDTSSSMANDISQVRDYIERLVAEQVKAGVTAVYVVTTFADPSSTLATKSKTFYSTAGMFRYLDNLVPSVGGDCEERTCDGVINILRNGAFWIRNAAMYVFTDAGSKDCSLMKSTIIRLLKANKASAFFILFDSCKKTIDQNYVSIARETDGFCLLIRDKGIYNITDTVNGAFESDALICGEHSDNSNSVVGQGEEGTRKKRQIIGGNRGRSPMINPKRPAVINPVEGPGTLLDMTEASGWEEKTIVVDTSIEKFKVLASIEPTSLLDKVKLEFPEDGDEELCEGSDALGNPNMVVTTSYADNSVVFDVMARSCPCTGDWKILYPAEAESFSYSVKSSGPFILGFESYFVDDTGPTRIANYAPCLGIEEYLVIKINQGEKVNTLSLTAKIIGVAGNVVHWEGALAADEAYTNTYIVKLIIPADMGTEGFRIMLEGALIDGVRFQRISSSYFYPTTSCVRITDVTNYYALFPNRKTFLNVDITNNGETQDEYTVTCSNSEHYGVVFGPAGPIVTTKGSKKKFNARSNPVVLKRQQTGKYTVSIQAPRKLVRGRTVTVSCRVLTATEELVDILNLTEMDYRF